MIKRFNITDYIMYLPPEYREKAAACKDLKELIQLSAEEDFEFPDELLEAIGGGAAWLDDNIPFCGVCGTQCRNKTIDRNKRIYCPGCRRLLDFCEIKWK